MEQFKVSVVVPAYNEQANIAPLIDKLCAVLGKYPDYDILFVDDGSTDGTLAALESAAAGDARIKYLSFSRNFGHQMALKAGLDYAEGDCVISMDADMQHPPEMIDAMIEKWQAGYEVVYTVRAEPKKLSLFKRTSSHLFYGLMSTLAKTKIEKGAADFRLLDRGVVNVLREVRESALFLRGMVSWVGFKQCALQYEQGERLAGQTKYSLRRMVSFALDGITSFSVKPLRLATFLGLTISGAAFIYGVYAVAMFIFTDRVVSGWTSVLGGLMFIGGLQLLMLGIFGEYLGKLFIESKKRPTYIVRTKKL